MKVAILFILAVSIISLSLFPQPVNAQTTRSDITGYLGLAIPVGDFASTTSNKAGLATTGWLLGGEYNWRKESLIVGGGLLLGSNPQDEAKFLDLIKQSSPTVTGLTSDGWAQLFLYGTAGYEKALSAKIDGYGKVYLGLFRGAAPEVKITAPSGTYTQTSATATGIGWGLGFGATLNRKYNLDIKYITAEPEYEFKDIFSSQIIKAKQPSATVQVAFGYVFQL